MVWCDYCAKNISKPYCDASKICCSSCGKVLDEDSFISEPLPVKTANKQVIPKNPMRVGFVADIPLESKQYDPETEETYEDAVEEYDEDAVEEYDEDAVEEYDDEEVEEYDNEVQYGYSSLLWCGHCSKNVLTDSVDHKLAAVSVIRYRCCLLCGRVLSEVHFSSEPLSVKIDKHQEIKLQRAAQLENMYGWLAEVNGISANPKRSEDMVDAYGNMLVESKKIDLETEKTYEEAVDGMAELYITRSGNVVDAHDNVFVESKKTDLQTEETYEEAVDGMAELYITRR